MRKNGGGHQNNKFSVNTSVEVLIVILFNEGHQGMLKRHVYLRWDGFSVCVCVGGGRDGAISKRWNIL